MSNGIDYKQKYLSIRQKLISSVDTAYRMGYTNGMKEGQMQMAQQQMQQQQQEMQAQQQMMAQRQQIPGGDPSQQGQPQESGQPQQEQGSDEMAQYIQELEQIVNKSEFNPQDLMKSISKMKTAQNKEHKLSLSYTHNMTPDAKRDLSLQEKVLSDMMNKWEKESSEAQTEMNQVLGVEGVLSKAQKG